MVNAHRNSAHIAIPLVISLLMIGSAEGKPTLKQIPQSQTTGPKIGQIQLPPGFFAEEIYHVPGKTQGSWIALTIDPQGRLIASAQSKGLFRITPPSTDGKQPTHVEKIDLSIGQAQGLLCAFDCLYVVVNGSAAEGSGLYKVVDTDDDDQYDQIRLLRRLNGAGEHGPHSVVLAPDGETLLVIGGNGTAVPDCDRHRPPRVWGPDSILSPQNDSRGFGAHLQPSGGWVCRTDPEGRDWELLAIGLRNAYDLAVNKEGELFTFDSDNEWDMTMPWYRPTRVCHICSGAEFGWRRGTGKWPDYRPDSLPSVVDVGPGSPTGISFGYGTRFPEKYQNTLFLGDWSFGNIYAVHLTSRGGSYEGVVESFASAVPLPVTDLVVRPQDGMLYFTTGGRGIASSLYRIGYHQPVRPTTEFHLQEPPISIARRRKLEAFHEPAMPSLVNQAIDSAWPFLSSPDRHLRYAARLVLEHQPSRLWQVRALEEKTPQTLIQAAIALCRTQKKDNPHLQQRLCGALDAVPWKTLCESEKVDLLRAYQLAIIRLGDPSEQLRSQMLGKLNRLYPSSSEGLNAELCQLLVALKSPFVVPRTLSLIASAKTQQEKIHYMLCLRFPKLAWTNQERQCYFAWFRRLQAYQGGESYESFLAQIHREACAHLTEKEQQFLGELINFNLEESSPTNVSVIQTARPFVRHWKMEDFQKTAHKLPSLRNKARGESLFAEVGCVRCHRIAGNGGILGPDLTTIASRFTEKDMLEAILEPNQVISDQYRATIFTLSDGKRVTGHIADIHKGKWSLITNMLQPRDYTPIDPRSIEHSQPSPVSMMPTGLLDTLTREEILDLLTYLQVSHDRL